MENLENFENFFPQEEKVNFRKVFVIMLKNWPLFALFGVLGLAAGYIYIRITQVVYQSKAAIYAPRKSATLGAGLEDLFKMQFTNDKSEVYNQIEIIKSFNINYMVVRNLNWRTSWFIKDGFIWNNCYKSEPFIVRENEGALNIPGVRISIKPLSQSQYKLSVDDDVFYQEKEMHISFSSKVDFGRPFVNEFFHFTLFQRENESYDKDGSYYFVFNDPAQMARNYLKNLVVKLNDKQSEIIRLQLESDQPERDIDYLNQLIAVYMQNKMNFQTETQKKSLQFIDKQLVGISDSVNSASSNFTRFKSQNQIVNIDAQGNQVMTTLKEIESDKVKNQMRLDYFRNLYEYIEKSDNLKNLIAPSVVGVQDVSLNTMVMALGELYNRRQILSFSAKDDNPSLLLINREINQTTAQLKENLRNLIKNAELQNKTFQEQEKEINSRLRKLPQKEQDMIHYQRRYELNNEIYTFMLQKRAEIDISLAGATPEVQIIDAARLETTDPVGLPRLIKILLGLFVGILLPAIYLLIKHMIADTIELQEDVDKDNQLPILGNVIHSTSNSDTPVYENPRSGIAESFRGIRTNLQFMLTDRNRKVVAIHSTNPGEGKSFTSVNLSTILAMNDKKVVLVVTDLRKPSIHKILNVSNNRGLSTFLSGQNSLDEVVQETFIKNLHLIPAGPIPPNPSELLDRPEMGKLIISLKKEYDFVIMDNAPVAVVTDGQLCARHADLNVFILRYGISKKDQVPFINQLAETKKMNNIALIVNDIKGRSFGYGRNYSYNYKYSGYSHGYYYQDKGPRKSLTRMLMDRLNSLLG